MRLRMVTLAASLVVLPAIGFAGDAAPAKTAPDQPVPAKAAPDKTATAIFAGGCFWCVQADFDHEPGVTATEAGYTGGHVDHPSYAQVVTETTGHYESVKVTYDPAKVSYKQLVAYFFHHIDPTDAGGQFCDRGQSYESAIFVAGPDQKKIAENEKAAVQKQLGGPVATKILDASTFWPAEGYHQEFYKKEPMHYKFYRWNCGRDQRVHDVWANATAKTG